MKKMLLVAYLALFVLTAVHGINTQMSLASDTAGNGKYLVDDQGMTLYWFTKDSIGHSACEGGCVEKWPLYHSEMITPPAGTSAADFGEITRSDGKKQTTFRGYPLYYFFKDKMAGDAKGEGVKGVWYVIDPKDFPKS